MSWIFGSAKEVKTKGQDEHYKLLILAPIKDRGLNKTDYWGAGALPLLGGYAPKPPLNLIRHPKY
jgi:hypothetical protein